MEILFIVGRILFGGFFVMTGLNHFTKLQAMTGYAASKKVPSPKLATLATGVLLVAGGIGVIFYTHITIALWLLIIFLVPTSLIMHTFWKETDPQMKMVEMTNFMKNIALAGAALMLLV